MKADLAASPATAEQFVALTGNPNCGKTTIFNALTGLRAKVGNYAGVTVERKEGALKGANGITLLDLPGTYSLSPRSLDEQISRDVLFHRLDDVPAPSLVVVVADASNLERNLYYVTQVIELGYPTLVALNMMDVAEQNGHQVDAAKLAQELGVPVLPLVASDGRGVKELREKIISNLSSSRRKEAPSSSERGMQSTESAAEATPKLPPSRPTDTLSPSDGERDGVRGLLASSNTIKRELFCELPQTFTDEVEQLTALFERAAQPRFTSPRAEALLVLTDEKTLAATAGHYPPEIHSTVTAARQRLDTAGIDWRSAAIEARYARIGETIRAVVTEVDLVHETFSDKVDRVVTHKAWGMLIFVALMALIFQSIFTFAKIPMDFLTGVVDGFGGWVAGLMGPGDLNDLLVNGVIKGVGAVVVFLPQICLLFLFISLLEDTGYMARAAFLMDRLMSKVGLHGKSFIPMLSSFACAIPGIMATRTIESPKDRLVTILVAPLMSCSARLPVYTVLIAACIPDVTLFGFWKLSGITMLAMYLLGIIGALTMAWLFKKTLLKSGTPMLIMELPPYKRPVLAVTLRHMWDRSKLFLRRAGTVILGINILLWFLATYPKTDTLNQISSTNPIMEDLRTFSAEPASPEVERKLVERKAEWEKLKAGENLRHSFAGRLGRLIEPVIAPLGFDWKMGIGIVASFAAREVFVSTMSVVYNVGDYDKSDTGTTSLAEALKKQKHPDGRAVYTPLTAVTLMVFYVFALQCVSTVAVVRRETNSWKWPLFQWAYMGALAWVLAFLTYHGGRLLGWQ